MTVGLALLSSLLWGSADFLGGTLSRRLPAAAVVLASQSCALAGLVVIVPLVADLRHPGGWAGWGAAGGLVGMLALMAFYRALATGVMGVVAPIAALGVIVPIAVGLITGDRPGPLRLAGIVFAVAGAVLASRTRGRVGGEAARSLLLALVAAVGFGVVLVLVAQGSRVSVGGTLLAQRTAAVAVLGFARLIRGGPRSVRLSGGQLVTVAALGAGDVLANAAYGVATHGGLVSVVAVLASLYPVVTVLLARRLHTERLTRGQAAGVLATLVGVAALAAG